MKSENSTITKAQSPALTQEALSAMLQYKTQLPAQDFTLKVITEIEKSSALKRACFIVIAIVCAILLVLITSNSSSQSWQLILGQFTLYQLAALVGSFTAVSLWLLVDET